MLYNNRGYTIEIPDDLYWRMTDEQFNEYIDGKFIESFNSKDTSSLSPTHKSDLDLPSTED